MSWIAGLVSAIGSSGAAGSAAGGAGTSGAAAAGTGAAGAAGGAGAGAGSAGAAGAAGGTGAMGGTFSSILSKAMPSTTQAASQNSETGAMDMASALNKDAERYKMPIAQFAASAPQGGYSAVQMPPAMQRRQTPTITGFNL